MKKELGAALRLTILLTLVTGLLYPAAVWLAAQALFPHQANGSLITRGGTVVGSTLIGQSFTRPEYFHPRPSAAGDGYDASASGGTSLGATSDKLVNGVVDPKDPKNNFDGVKQLAAHVREENGLPPTAPVPVDAVTRSGSGLDPDITPAYAALQIPRVARARHLTDDQVHAVVASATHPRQLGMLGEERVNVLEANLALDAMGK